MDAEGILKACTTNWRITSAKTMAKMKASIYSRTTDLAFRCLMLASSCWTLCISCSTPAHVTLRRPGTLHTLPGCRRIHWLTQPQRLQGGDRLRRQRLHTSEE